MSQLRAEVESMIKKADDRFLQMVYALAVTYHNGEIVAYTTAGEPLTKEGYLRAMEDGRTDIEYGKTISTDDLKKQVERWKGKYNR